MVMETFVNDEFRGELLIIKSNEQENPFKDSALGADKSNISRASYWTIKLLDGFEGVEYVHLTSETPAVSLEGTHIFTASRGVGVANNTLKRRAWHEGRHQRTDSAARSSLRHL